MKQGKTSNINLKNTTMESLSKSPKLQRAYFNNAVKTKKLTRDCKNIESQRKSFLKEQHVELTSFLRKLENKSKICASTKVDAAHKNVSGHTKRNATSVGNVIHKAIPDSYGKSENLPARQWLNHWPHSEQEKSLCNLESKKLSTQRNSDSHSCKNKVNNFSNSNIFVPDIMCKQKASSTNSTDKNEEPEHTSLREIDDQHASFIERPQCLQFDAFRVRVLSNSDLNVKVTTKPRLIQRTGKTEHCNVIEGLKYGRCTSSLSGRRNFEGTMNLGTSLSLPEIKNKSSSTPCLVTAQIDLDGSTNDFQTLKRSQIKTKRETFPSPSNSNEEQNMLGNSDVEIRVIKTDEEDQEVKCYRNRSIFLGGSEILSNAALNERNDSSNEDFAEQDAQIYEQLRGPNLAESLDSVRGLRYLRNHDNKLRRHSTGNPDMDDFDYIWASIKQYSTDNTILGHTKTFF